MTTNQNLDDLSRANQEALAQVAVFIQAVEGARHPDGMPNEGDIQFWYERLNHAVVNTSLEAHALLNRLQRAEAVVKAVEHDHQGCDACSAGDRCIVGEALAAWEEGMG